MSLVYVIGNDAGVSNLFKYYKHDVVNINNPIVIGEDLPDPDLVVFTGGSDVWPQLYGEKNTHSSVSIKRDIEELVWFHRFRHSKKVGICRGGQFLNVCNGGKMLQDIPDHAIAGEHTILDDNMHPTVFYGTSTHHQAMQGHGALVSGRSEKKTGSVQEVLWYGDTQSLCFQPHPEYGSMEIREDNTLSYFDKCLRFYLNFAIADYMKVKK